MSAKKLLILFVLILCFPIGIFFYFLNRTYPNIYVDGINIGNKTQSEVKSLLKIENKSKTLTLNYQNQSFTLDTASLNITVDKNKTIDRAFLLGRSGNILFDGKFILSSFKNKTSILPFLKIDDNALSNTISSISQKIAVPPSDARFVVTNGKVENFAPETNGLKINEEILRQEIIRASTSDNDSILAIPVEVDYAKVKTSDINILGIKELIGSGTSHFAGSITSRIFNIKKAASTINGTLIAPDTDFSFDKVIGDISAANGYQQAYVIQNGQTVLGDGGGVCQVSTTIFRAAMNSGLPITERHAHAYRVHYYEEDAPPGMDATIYTPSIDFKFKNDTGNYILVQTQIDLKNLVLTFNFYGTKDGRTAEITKPKLWDAKPAPPDLYTDDPTLPVGTVKQVDFAAPGLKSTFDYTVTRSGKVINKQTFYSNFQPWQAKFLRGTKV